MFLLKWKVKILYPLNSDRKWMADNNNLTSKASSSLTFKKRFLSRDCVVVRYHNTLTCEDEESSKCIRIGQFCSFIKKYANFHSSPKMSINFPKTDVL